MSYDSKTLKMRFERATGIGQCSEVTPAVSRRHFLGCGARVSAGLLLGRLAEAQAPMADGRGGTASQHSPPLTARTFSSPRHTTRYWEAGPANGPLIIFLHGWPQIGLMWRAQVEAFASEGRARAWIALADQRFAAFVHGPGLSPREAALLESQRTHPSTAAADPQSGLGIHSRPSRRGTIRPVSLPRAVYESRLGV